MRIKNRNSEEIISHLPHCTSNGYLVLTDKLRVLHFYSGYEPDNNYSYIEYIDVTNDYEILRDDYIPVPKPDRGKSDIVEKFPNISENNYLSYCQQLLTEEKKLMAIKVFYVFNSDKDLKQSKQAIDAMERLLKH